MVHRGYARELDGVGGLLVEMARDHAAGGKPLYVTGHSAGGALGDAGRPPPARGRRAGAGGGGVLRPARRRPALRRELPVPLLRIEHRHDLIPHLPLPPSLARSSATGWSTR